jgi:hypothetical protein
LRFFSTGIRIKDAAHRLEIWQQLKPQELTQLAFSNGMKFAFVPGRDGRVYVTGEGGSQNSYSIGTGKMAPKQSLPISQTGVIFEQHAPLCQSPLDQRLLVVGETEFQISGVSFGATAWQEKATGAYVRQWRNRCQVVVSKYVEPGTSLPKALDRTRSFHMHLGQLSQVVFTKDDSKLSKSSGSRGFYLYPKARPARGSSPEQSSLKLEVLEGEKARLQWDAHETWIVDLKTAQIVDSPDYTIENKAPIPESHFSQIAKLQGGWALRPKREGDLIIVDEWLLGPQSPKLKSRAEIWRSDKPPCAITKSDFFKLREAGNDDLDPKSWDHADLNALLTKCR